MWDLKLFLSDILFFNSLYLNFFVIYLNDFLNPTFLQGLTFLTSISVYNFSQNMTFFLMTKFILVIMFLILIRGGTPRYRYDYLTKLGWLKFLGFIVTLFLVTLFFYFLF